MSKLPLLLLIAGGTYYFYMQSLQEEKKAENGPQTWRNAFQPVPTKVPQAIFILSDTILKPPGNPASILSSAFESIIRPAPPPQQRVPSAGDFSTMPVRPSQNYES